MAGSDKLKSTQRTNEDVEAQLEALEKLIDRTKVLYEQYFMGIQKLAPSQLHKDLERRMRELAQDQIRNTGLRFRFVTLQQKLGSYNSYWRRVLRQIELGQYVRHVARASRKAERTGADVPEELLIKLPKRMQDRIRRDRVAVADVARRRAESMGEPAGAVVAEGPAPTGGLGATLARASADRRGAFQIGDALEDGDFDSMFDALTDGGATPRPAAPPSPPAPPPASNAAPPAAPRTGSTRPPPIPPRATSAAVASGATRPPPDPPPPPPGMTERQCRELHARYVKARQLVGQASDMTYEKLVASLGQQAPVIMKQHGARGVEFNVVVKGDKVVLKAKPQK